MYIINDIITIGERPLISFTSLKFNQQQCMDKKKFNRIYNIL